MDSVLCSLSNVQRAVYLSWKGQDEFWETSGEFYAQTNSTSTGQAVMGDVWTGGESVTLVVCSAVPSAR